MDQNKIPEKILVELVLPDLDLRSDAELPSRMPVASLRKGLLALLKEKFPRRFSKVADITVAYRGQKLPDDATLASVGIWDGSTLELGKVSKSGGYTWSNM